MTKFLTKLAGVFKKSFFPISAAFGGFGGAGAWENVYSDKALKLWQQVTPLSTAVSIIVRDFRSIQPFLFNQNKEIFEDRHEVLDLLNAPNPYQTWEDFSEALITDGLITGQYYFLVAYSGRKPLFIQRLNPGNIQTQKGANGYPDALHYRTDTSSQTFTRKIDKGGIRYVNPFGDKAVFIRQSYNPFSSTEGLGVVSMLFYPIKQYLESERHNLSLLELGGRPSGLIHCASNLDKEQRDEIKASISSKIQSSRNAGRILFFDGGKFDFKELSQSMKDMDFVSLKDRAELAIYKKMQIPLPLVSTQTMTYDNYAEANLVLLEKVVLPLADDLFGKLSSALLPSYGIDYQYQYLTYNAAKIPVLQEKNFRTVKTLKETGVATVNELRARLGMDPIAGGDVIYQSAAEIPLGTTFGFDYQNAPQEKRLRIKRFLSAAKDEKGLPLYTPQEIDAKLAEVLHGAGAD